MSGNEVEVEEVREVKEVEEIKEKTSLIHRGHQPNWNLVSLHFSPHPFPLHTPILRALCAFVSSVMNLFEKPYTASTEAHRLDHSYQGGFLLYFLYLLYLLNLPFIPLQRFSPSLLPRVQSNETSPLQCAYQGHRMRPYFGDDGGTNPCQRNFGSPNWLRGANSW